MVKQFGVVCGDFLVKFLVSFRSITSTVYKKKEAKLLFPCTHGSDMAGNGEERMKAVADLTTNLLNTINEVSETEGEDMTSNASPR